MKGMMMNIVKKGFLVLLTLFSQYALGQKAGEEKPLPFLNPVLIASQLTGPVGLESPNDGTGRLFILEQKGTIRIIKAGRLLEKPFLDLSSKMVRVRSSYDERGLLGLAFHPEFKRNGRFFVYYSIPTEKSGFDHIGRLSGFKVEANSDFAKAESEEVILDIPQPESNHNGGALLFGPDGYLYLGLGDGGGQGDKHGTIGNSQNFDELLGSVLRIDINGNKPYSIPSDNPDPIGKKGRPEIWAKGFRNPWRCSFEPVKGRLFCGDVGQNKYEEVDWVEKGKNYGWRYREGFECYNPKENCPKEGLTDPIDSYPHSVGESVCGGYMVVNNTLKGLNGYYIFADWNGKVFALKENEKGPWQRTELNVNHPDFGVGKLRINSMGTDSQNRIYLLTQTAIGPLEKTGKVYRLEVK